MIRLISWNVNGIRSVHRKGFLEWFASAAPDVLCLQETKIAPGQLPQELAEVPGYRAAFTSADRPGYSGVALYSRDKPLAFEEGLGIPRFDTEGRTQVARFPGFTLYNIYYPNGKASPERLAFKLAFYDAFLEHAERRRAGGESIVVCGDLNTAHREIDLARPKANEAISGFLPEERAWVDTFLAHGYIDTFRLLHDVPDRYTWWDYKSRARERNVGWRLDYFFVSDDLRDRIADAYILDSIDGSDHCPVGLDLNL